MVTTYKHLALVRRDEVIELFKNGRIYPTSSEQFDGGIEALPKTKTVTNIFNKIPSIAYSIDYFMLYAHTQQKKPLHSQGLKIEDLIAVYPLDEESARLGLSLMPPIKLEAPIFAADYAEYQKRVALNNAKMGISNIESIFKVDNLMKSIKKFKAESLSSLVSLVMDETGNRNPQTIWEYLLCYNRNAIYPNDARGAFLDMMSVLCNFKEKRVSSKDQKQTTTGKAIEEHESHKYQALKECISAKIIEEANNAYPEFWQIAPLYFILFDHLSTCLSEDGTLVNGTPIQDFVKRVTLNYEAAHLNPALLMLGITFGQANTYKMLYAVKKRDLPFLL